MTGLANSLMIFDPCMQGVVEDADVGNHLEYDLV